MNALQIEGSPSRARIILFLKKVSPPDIQLELTEKNGTSQKKQNLLLFGHLKIRPVALPRKSGKVNSYLAVVTQ